uniref:Scarecrow-like protein 14 n=1 Tax=Cajanus cajan TaxID=3821 RepID=A0A151TMC6_CAJCA|nr:Scarecrow-like protein 14 [Cajanus cajan]
MLMEEDLEEKPCMFNDSLALQAAEKSFYDVIGETYPSYSSSIQNSQDSPDESSSISGSTTLFSKSESVLQFERGVEEANKFLPKGNPLVIDLENPSFVKVPPRTVEIKAERDEISPESRGRKNHEREDGEAELQDGRSNKQSAVYTDDDSELSELLDKILLGARWGNEPAPLCICFADLPNGPSLGKLEEAKKSDGGKSRVKKQSNKKGVVDLSTLLILCAQAVSSDDRVTANELLKQIRQHSSPLGDGTQRLAHSFANALDARLAGTGTQIYTALSNKKTSAADMVKAYQMYISACPFKKLAIIFANHTILHLAKEVETLHIIDFGIRYGFQPKERVQETGLRLARYCDRFNVPFEFNAIAQKWETIKLEDLKIKENELLAVNAMFRFQNLLDETVVSNSPRDTVLNLIRKANPNIFIHATVNGSYNAPFFVTRFREALFHYSTLFDVLDTNTAREDPMRLMFEKEFFGRRVMNIIACEGCERVERPETYKQWQVRHMRAGFRQLPLDQQLINKLRCKSKETGKFINQILMEENVQQRPFYDSLSLQLTEKSFYHALTGTLPLSPHQHPLVHSPETETTNTSSSSNSNNGDNFFSDENSREFKPPSPSPDSVSVSVSAFQFNPHALSQPPSLTVADRLSDLDSSIAKLLAQNIFSDVDSVSQFRRGLEEASKFLPPGPNLVTPLGSKGEQSNNTLGDDSYGLKLKVLFTVTMEANFPFGEEEKDESILYVSDSLGFAATDLSLEDKDNDFSETAKFISQILMEENVEHRPFYDSFSLQVTEKSFYHALIGNLPHSPNQHSLVLSPEPEITTTTSKNNFLDQNSNLDSSIAKLLAHNIFNDADSISQFRRGMEEASKFLPPGPNLVTALDSKGEQPINTFEQNSYGLKGRKNHKRPDIQIREEEDDDDEEGRSNKQSALSLADENDLSDAIDRVFVCVENVCNEDITLHNGATKVKEPDGGGKKGRPKKHGRKKETVDLRNLLLMSAQSVYANDFRTANEYLKKVRQYSSPTGDASQRLAHYFANGLEARLIGGGTTALGFFSLLSSKKVTAAEFLKAYQIFLSTTPFTKFTYFFANKMIGEAAAKAETVHIIDFGILHGFQWPILIKFLSKREGGPPKLRITGIEFPQPGFRPTEKIEETGRRLANYCKRYNVPFEYHAIASRSWETIQVEALKIERNEVVAVNCYLRFENLLDESTDELDSPRNARPETYKQWQVRITRVGFKQLPLNKELMAKFRTKLREYHRDFVLDEDNNWMLQGWKGRIFNASTCWVPA